LLFVADGHGVALPTCGPTVLPAIVAFRRSVGICHVTAIHEGRSERSCSLVFAVPFSFQSAFRQARVGDFNIVSFGGFQMSGMQVHADAGGDRSGCPARSTARVVPHGPRSWRGRRARGAHSAQFGR
jgi:hypothetical protein